jgi:hypothetical protein
MYDTPECCEPKDDRELIAITVHPPYIVHIPIHYRWFSFIGELSYDQRRPIESPHIS